MRYVMRRKSQYMADRCLLLIARNTGSVHENRSDERLMMPSYQVIRRVPCDCRMRWLRYKQSRIPDRHIQHAYMTRGGESGRGRMQREPQQHLLPVLIWNTISHCKSCICAVCEACPPVAGASEAVGSRDAPQKWAKIVRAWIL